MGWSPVEVSAVSEYPYKREADKQIYHFYLEGTLFGVVVKYDR